MFIIRIIVSIHNFCLACFFFLSKLSGVLVNNLWSEGVECGILSTEREQLKGSKCYVSTTSRGVLCQIQSKYLLFKIEIRCRLYLPA